MVLQGKAYLITETLGIRGIRQVANGPSGLENHAFYLLFPLWTPIYHFPHCETYPEIRKLSADSDCRLTLVWAVVVKDPR